jgi:restriction system protein
VRRMGWPEFCAALERGFARDGFSVRRVQGVADLLLQHGSQRTLVSARRWKAARLGEESLQALQAAAIAHEAGSSLCICLGEVSPQARQFAQRNGIRLMQADGLVQLLSGVLPSSV